MKASEKSDDSGAQEEGRSPAECDGCFNVRAAGLQVEHHNDQMTTSSPSPGAAVPRPSVNSSDCAETISRVPDHSRSPQLLSTTPSADEGQRNLTGLPVDARYMLVPAGDIDCPSSTPTFSSAGPTNFDLYEHRHQSPPSSSTRLDSIAILERILPLQRRHVLDLVLSECRGDLVRVIEHFLSAQQDNIQHGQHHLYLQQQQQQLLLQLQSILSVDRGRSVVDHGDSDVGWWLPISAAAVSPHGVVNSSTLSSLPVPFVQSTFAPSLPLQERRPPLHPPYISPRAAAFTTEALLACRPPGTTSDTPPASLVPTSPPSSPRLEAWLQRSSVNVQTAAALTPLILPGRHHHEAYQLHRLQPGSLLHTPLAHRMTCGMMSTSHAPAPFTAAALTARAVAVPGSSTARAVRREAMTSNVEHRHHQLHTGEDKPLNLQCRRDTSSAM